MRRRDFVTLLCGGLTCQPLAARASQVDQLRHIGVLMNGSADDPVVSSCVTTFQEALEKLGWQVGRNLQIDCRWYGGDAGTAVAESFLDPMPDVIVADGRQALEVFRHAALTIPVVFMEIDQPVFYGFVQSLTHPGGNMTGFTGLEPSVGAKWLELLKEMVPSLARAAVIFNPQTAPRAVLFSLSAEAAAQRLAVEVIRVPVFDPVGIEAVMTMLTREPGGGLILPVDAFTTVRQPLVLELAARSRLPAIYGVRNAAAAGGLASYGIDLVSLLRQAAGYVDRILRGAKAADLPVRKPTKLRLVINAKSAKALGLHVPPNALALADEVIE